MARGISTSRHREIIYFKRCAFKTAWQRHCQECSESRGTSLWAQLHSDWGPGCPFSAGGISSYLSPERRQPWWPPHLIAGGTDAGCRMPARLSGCCAVTISPMLSWNSGKSWYLNECLSPVRSSNWKHSWVSTWAWMENIFWFLEWKKSTRVQGCLPKISVGPWATPRRAEESEPLPPLLIT